jgi:hypothetical protein
MRCKLSNNPFFRFFLALLCRASTDSASPSQTRSASQPYLRALSQRRSPALQTPNRGLPINNPFFSFHFHALWSGKHRRSQFFPNSPCHASPRNAPTSSADHQRCRPQTASLTRTVSSVASILVILCRASTVSGRCHCFTSRQLPLLHL